MIRLPGNHQLEVCVRRDVHGIDGVKGGFPREQGVHVQICRNEIADDGVVAEDFLHIERTRRDGAFDDLFSAMNAGVGHIVVGNLLHRGSDIAIRIHGDSIEPAVLALDHQFADSQRDHIGLRHGQLGDVELARSTLCDDGGVRCQILDVRPIDVGGFNICFDHGGHGS